MGVPNSGFLEKIDWEREKQGRVNKLGSSQSGGTEQGVFVS